ncbi:unnamed protein product [Prunus brigantina]
MGKFVHGLHREFTQVRRVWLNFGGGRQVHQGVAQLHTRRPRTGRVHKALLRRYEGPFPIIRMVGRAAYRVEPPPRLKIHPMFHVSNLKPYHANPKEPSRGESQRAPPLIATSFDMEVECIMAKREVQRKGVSRYFEYFVK